jgi:hypothetical protein
MTTAHGGRIALSAIMIVCLMVEASAGAVRPRQESGKASGRIATVAGKWTMTVKGARGGTPMALTLEQTGKKVTGTFNPHGEDFPVSGELFEGTLTLATPRSADSRISFTAKLKENGTLEGYLSSQMGDMTWTAERIPVKNDKDAKTGKTDR